MAQIDLYNFLSDKTIIHSEDATDYETGLIYFVINVLNQYIIKFLYKIHI